MPDCESPPFVVLTSDAFLPASKRVWGTGGWLHPSQREALDWLTLSTLLGWRNAPIWIDGAGLPSRGTEGIRWLIVACDPADVGEQVVAWIARQLTNEPALLVTRAGGSGSALAHLVGAAAGPELVAGRSLAWIGPADERRWTARSDVYGRRLVPSPGSETWVTLDGEPCVCARRVGRGLAVTLGFHPSEVRDCDPAGSALIKHLLIFGAPGAVAWLDLNGTLVLRMDDAGGAQNVHSRSWQYSKLMAGNWSAMCHHLTRLNARISIGYSAGWVDDGDASRGRLTVGGEEVPREPGRVHPSSLVLYEDRAGNRPGCVSDYRSEFQGIQALRQSGLGDVEVHGFTHMRPDGAAWARAADRYDNTWWFRELGNKPQDGVAPRSADRRQLAQALGALRDQFGVVPTTLICPGDQWTDETLECALDLDLQLVASYYLALRDGSRFWWCQHICAPYLDTPDAAWFRSELPVVGYFHDRDLALEGVVWMQRWLDAWKAAGARRLVDFRELAGVLSRKVRIEKASGSWVISVSSDRGGGLVRPLPVLFTHPRDHCPRQVRVELASGALLVDAEHADVGIGRVHVPPEPPSMP